MMPTTDSVGRGPVELRVARVAALAGVLFVCSGLSGLIYQAVWSQYLGLVLGHAAYAQALVLAIFMGGMALGAAWSGRRSRQVAQPLRQYGVVEGLIGLSALLFHPLYLLVSEWLFNSALPATHGGVAADALRWSVAVLLILPQSILLGMTFPLMSSALVRLDDQRAGRTLGLLYFLNSIGAALGALLATFLIVPWVGLPGAMQVAGVVNLLILLVAVWIRVPAAVAVPVRADTERADDAPVVRRILIVAAVTGLSSFMYEIGWVRMLSMALGSSLHAFEIMLAAFIGGLAFGGLYVRRHLHERRNPLRLVGVVQVAMGCAALATLVLYDASFSWVSWLLNALGRSDQAYVLYNVATALIAILIMVPAAFCAGMTLPGLTYALLRRTGSEQAIGQVYAVNTLGSIAGVFLMIHLAIPLLGLKYSMVAAGSLDLLLGLWLLAGEGATARRLRMLATGAAVVAVVCAVALADFDPRRLASGVFRTGQAEVDEAERVLYYKDGKTASIALTANPQGSLMIMTNGKPDASIQMLAGRLPTYDEPTMILLGSLGYAYRPDAREIGIIGFGSGLTTHVVAASPNVARIETVEIEPRIVEAASGFGNSVARAFTDRRSHIIYDDARAHFSAGQRHYDVIISEPSNPWVSGVAKLFSQEFYRFIPRHLGDDGILVQWIHTYEISRPTVLSIFAALDASFSDYHVYMANEADLIIVATANGELPAPTADFLQWPDLVELGERITVRGSTDLAARRMLDKADIRAMLDVAAAPVNSDFHPYVAYRAPLDRFRGAAMNDLAHSVSGPGGVWALLHPLPDAADLQPPVLPHPLVQRRLEGRLLARAMTGAVEPQDLAVSPSMQWLAFELDALATRCYDQVPAPQALANMLLAFELTAFAEQALRRAAWSVPLAQDCVARGGDLVKLRLILGDVAGGSCVGHADALAALARQFPASAAGLTALSLYCAAPELSPIQLQDRLHASLGELRLNEADQFYLAVLTRWLANRSGNP